MNIPTEPYPFGNIESNANLFEDDGISFDFINASSDPRLLVSYDKGSCLEKNKYIAKQLNLGAIMPVAGINADDNPVNPLLKVGGSCLKPDNFINPFQNRVGNLEINGLGVFAPSYNNTFSENKLFDMIPEAFVNTTSNSIKNESDAIVYGDPMIIPNLGTYRLKDVAAYYDTRKPGTVKENDLEKTPKAVKPVIKEKKETTEKKLNKFLDYNLAQQAQAAFL